MGLFGKITTGIARVGETVVETAGGLAEGAKQAFSDRVPTPKQIGGPLNAGLDESIRRAKEKAAGIIVTGLDPVFGEGAPLDIAEEARAGEYGAAITELPVIGKQYIGEEVVKPITEGAQALTLPLLAVAGILLLK